MGQQQLLLIILGVIIVGIAVAVGITMFQDNAVDQNRSAVIADLTTLAAKAQQFYAKPISLGGGGNAFDKGGDAGNGLTATATGLSYLAGPAFTKSPANGGQNANGDYTIKSNATATQVILQGVGTTALSDNTFPTYEMTVTSSSQVPVKKN